MLTMGMHLSNLSAWKVLCPVQCAKNIAVPVVRLKLTHIWKNWFAHFNRSHGRSVIGTSLNSAPVASLSPGRLDKALFNSRSSTHGHRGRSIKPLMERQVNLTELIVFWQVRRVCGLTDLKISTGVIHVAAEMTPASLRQSQCRCNGDCCIAVTICRTLLVLVFDVLYTYIF